MENSGVSIIQNAHLICVDIQPEYENYFNFNIYSLIKFLNENVDNMNSLTFLYNGQDSLGMISEYDYKNWLLENDLNEDIIDFAKYFDKGYAFFRFRIDNSIDENKIVNLIKFMIQNSINNSRDFDEEMWNNFIESYGYESTEVRDLLEFADDCINIPDLMDYLNKYSGKIIICGGGINECFKEVEIALTALEKFIMF